MDSMEAMMRAEQARAAGDKFKVYDYKKAKRLIELHSPAVASLGIAEDWDWTGMEVYESGHFLVDLNAGPAIAGINGSIWGTPQLEMDGVRQDCFKESE